jgi:hypothetical protein
MGSGTDSARGRGGAWGWTHEHLHVEMTKDGEPGRVRWGGRGTAKVSQMSLCTVEKCSQISLGARSGRVQAARGNRVAWHRTWATAARVGRGSLSHLPELVRGASGVPFSVGHPLIVHHKLRRTRLAVSTPGFGFLNHPRFLRSPGVCTVASISAQTTEEWICQQVAAMVAQLRAASSHGWCHQGQPEAGEPGFLGLRLWQGGRPRPRQGRQQQ